MIASRRACGAYALSALALLSCGGGQKNDAATPIAVESRPHRINVAASDDDQDDDLDVVSSRGKMDLAVVQATIAPQSAALSDCYTSRVDGRRWLGGTVTIHWDLAASGELVAAALSENTLGAWPVEKCILDIARGLKWPAPKGGPTDFTVPLEFSQKSKAAVWDEDRSLAAIGGQTIGLRECGQDGNPQGKSDAKPAKSGSKAKRHGRRSAVEFGANPNNDGMLATPNGGIGNGSQALVVPGSSTEPTKVLVTVYVGPGGKAQSAGFATMQGSPPSDDWFTCAEKVAMAWRLPDPRGQYAKLSIAVPIK
jgi:hypothetical protein